MAPPVLWSKLSVQDIVDALLTIEQLEPRPFLYLEVEGGETLTVRIAPDPAKATAADGSETLWCVTPEGREVKLLLGQPSERMIRCAIIILDR